MAKEWKGNSASVRSRLAINKEHTTKGREQDDFYATDPIALRKLINGASDWMSRIMIFTETLPCIWEPACGNGSLCEELRRCGYPVFATDLKNRGYGISGIDFLKAKGTYECSIILTNPPYSLATEFIEHALDILPDNGLYIALMNISYLSGQKRFERVYSTGTLREVYIFSKRVQCYKNGDMSIKHSSMADFAWYVFQKGFKGQPTLYWL